MAAPFSHDHIARFRDGARRLAKKAGQHEDDVRRLLLAAESRLDEARIAWSKYDSAPGDALSDALQAQMVKGAEYVALVRHLCVSAREHALAAQRLGADLNGEEGEPSGTAPLATAVLVVDDYEDSREWLSVVLQNAGFMVRTATNGLEAVLGAYELQPAVIIMDVMMPVLDGVEAARLIKAIDELRAPRMIAYTAAPQPAVGDLFTAVLRKPAPPDVVVETVKRFAAA